MAENGLRERTIGVAFDGTGYGTDGRIWGGEFLICDTARFERAAHLRYVPLIGGDRAARDSWRMAAAYLFDAFGAEYRTLDVPVFDAVPDAPWKLFDQLLASPNNLLTSSCGRLFDAVSSIAGVCHRSSYEGEAAMLLEAAAEGAGDREYPFSMEGESVDTRPMIRAIVRDLGEGRSAHEIAAVFHSTVAAIIEAVCGTLRDRTGLNKVCLSGGTFQNFTLLGRAVMRLERAGFQVLTHSRVPPNDGGLSLGQAVVAQALACKPAQ
jgi:hydrogenase maturation protein HypF